MKNKLRNILDTKISIPVYIFMFASIMVAIASVISLSNPDVLNSAFSHNLVIKYEYWVWLLLVFSIVGFVGTFITNQVVLRVGTFMSFMMWLFAAVSYALSGLWIVLLIIGLEFTAFYAYIYLAASLDILKRTAIQQYKNN